AGADPFNWVKVHPLMSPQITALYPFDHAGIGETSLMLAMCPRAVEMDRVTGNSAWYTESAAQATAELGEKGRDMIVARLRGLLLAA
nr:creatininase family protein [Rhizobiaceae bacterium]